jgi:hypothetical protein
LADGKGVTSTLLEMDAGILNNRISLELAWYKKAFFQPVAKPVELGVCHP